MFPTMQAFVRPAQFLEGGFEESLVLDSLARAQGHQPIQTHIDTHRHWLLLWKDIGQFYLETDKPPVGRFGNPCAGDLAQEAEILGHIYPSELGHPETVIT